MKRLIAKNVPEMLFFIALGFYIITRTIEITPVFLGIRGMLSLMKCFRYISYLIIIVKLFMDRNYTLVEMNKIIGVILILILVSFVQQDNNVLCGFFFIMAARNINIKKTISFMFWSELLLMVLVVISSQIGVIEDWTYTIDDRFRHSLGYMYPSHIVSIFFFLVIAYFLLKEKEVSFVKLLLIEIVNIILYSLTISRTGFAITLIASLCLWMIRYRKRPIKNTLITKVLYQYSIFIIALVCVVVCISYDKDNSIMRMINDAVNNRVAMGHDAINNYGFTLLGTKIKWVAFAGLGYLNSGLHGTYNFVDCSYIKILVEYGVVLWLIVLAGYSKLQGIMIKKKNRYMCLGMLFMFIYCIIEPRLIEFGYNPFVLLLSVLFISNEDRNNMLKEEGNV